MMNIHHECLGEIRELRRLLWINHLDHYPYLYGDDGEMQCKQCMIDFKRDKVTFIERKLREAHDKFLQVKGVIIE